MNWLRAAVLGANDGIVSTAGLVVGVAGATDDRSALLTAGLAGLLAGSMSMAAGEYVSVSTQRDSEKAALALERREGRSPPTERQTRRSRGPRDRASTSHAPVTPSIRSRMTSA
ncbi:VIT1/CCC1 transporter family protein [Streptomyces mirabilis]